MKNIPLPKSITSVRALTITLLLSFSVISTHAQNPFAKSKQDLEERIGANRLRLEKRQLRPKKAIPAQVLKNAKGIVIVNRFKAGLLGVGAELGNGVALVRGADGKWGAPAFISLTKGAVGAMVGVDESVTFLFLMTDESLRLLRDGGAGGVGTNLQAVAGPLDVGGDIGSVSLRKPVLVYSDTKGAFIGVSLDAGALVSAKKKNATAYGLILEEILFSNKAVITPAGKQLIEAIEKYSGNTKD